MIDVLRYIEKMKEMYEGERITAQGPRNMADGGRIGLFGGGWLWKLLYKGKSGLQLGKVQKDLVNKYRKEGMSLIDAITKGNKEGFEIVNQRKLKIVKDKMSEVNIQSDDYVDLIDEHIKLTDPEFYKDIKRWDQTRPSLADKSRAQFFPDWAEARYGEDYHTVLERGQTREIQKSIDPNIKEPLSPADQMASDIDDMNKANLDELLEGRKKNAYGGRIGYADKNAGKLVQSRNQYGPFTIVKKIGGPQMIDYDVLEKVVKKANTGNKFFTEEEISKAYAEATGQTNVTKRKITTTKGTTIVTYKKLNTPEIKKAGILETKKDKISKVFNEILAMDKAVPEVDLGKYEGRRISKYRRYIIHQTGIGTTNVDNIIKTLPNYKNNAKAFKYLEKSGLATTDLINKSLSDQLNFAVDAAKGKPIFIGVKNINFADSSYTTMRIAKTNWNKNNGKGNIKFYNKKGDLITWKHGLELNVNDVSFSEGKSKKRFGIGEKKGTLNLRLEGEKYFPEVYQNQKYINQLKGTLVDNPFPGKKQISFSELMKKVYMKGHGWQADAPLFSIFHGSEGVAKQPFKNLSFGMQELNKAMYEIDKIPLKGLKQKIINQALVGLKGKKGGDLLEAIVAKHSDIASKVAAGQRFDKPLNIRVIEDIAKGGGLGSRETKVVANILTGWCSKGAQRVNKDEGGRIGFAGDCSPEEKITNMKNAAAQLKQHDRYLRGLSDTTPFADNAAARALASKMAKSGGLLMRAGRFALGPWTLWGEPLFEGAFIAHDILGTGTPWKEAVAKSLWAKPAISMGLLKPADQQYDEALWQVQNEEGEALMTDPYHERVRTPIKRFMDNNNKIDKLNKLYKLKQTSYIMGPKVFSQEERAAKMKKADETYNNYLESLGGAEGVTKINAQIENDREAYDDRVAALEIERKGLTEKDIFSPSAQRAADIKQKQAEEDIMYQKYGKTRVKSAGIKGTPGEFKKQWIIDPKLKDSFFPEEVLDPNFMRTVLDLPTEESWSPNYPKTYRDFYPTPSSRYGWSQMGPVAQAGGISKLAGGGIAAIRKPDAIAPTGGPQSQGLAYLKKYGINN